MKKPSKKSSKKLGVTFVGCSQCSVTPADRYCAGCGNRGLVEVQSAEQDATAEYAMGLEPQLCNRELQAIYRDAVSRVQQIFTRRLIGIVETDESRAADRRLLDGILELVVLPGVRAVFTCQPQVPFKPTRLVIDDESSAWYDVTDVKVGKNSQLVSVHPLPGSSFKSSVSQDLKMDTARVAMLVTVELVNVTSEPRRFPRVMMFGKCVKESYR